MLSKLFPNIQINTDKTQTVHRVWLCWFPGSIGNERNKHDWCYELAEQFITEPRSESLFDCDDLSLRRVHNINCNYSNSLPAHNFPPTTVDYPRCGIRPALFPFFFCFFFSPSRNVKLISVASSSPARRKRPQIGELRTVWDRVKREKKIIILAV